MIYVISKATFGSYNVRDIQCNANWCSCPYSDYALIPDGMVEGILATQGYCDIVLTEDGSEVAAFTAREIPSVPEECWGERTATEAYVDARTMIATDPNNDGNIVLQYGGNVVPGGGGSGGSGGTPGADGFSPIATVVPTEDGALITITDKNGTTEVAVCNGKDGAKGDPGATGKDGADGKSAYQYAQDGGYTGTEKDFGKKLAQEPLVGTTEEITPTQVSEAVSAGRDVSITHVDATYGAFHFNAFTMGVGIDVVYSTGIVNFNGVPTTISLYGQVSTNQWFTSFQSLAKRADIPTKTSQLTNDSGFVTKEDLHAESLVGTTADITPSQVIEAITNGRDLMIIYTDKSFGMFYFTSFDINASLGLVFSSAILQYSGMYAVVELIGNTTANTWQFVMQQIPIMSDIPTKTSQLENDSEYMTVGGYQIIAPKSLKNPYAMTINGTTYDGSSAVDMTAKINDLIDAKLGVIENGSY